MGGEIVCANERLAYLLGREVGLPIADLQSYTINDPASTEKIGVISVEQAEHWGPWSDFEQMPFFDKDSFGASCQRLVANLVSLRECVPFDIWIRNSDRHRGNILLNEEEPYLRYRVILIDHSHAFMHTDASLTGEFTDELRDGSTTFLRPEELRLAQFLVVHRCQFEDILARIEAIPEGRLRTLVGMATMACAAGAPPSFGEQLTEGLLERRKYLPETVARFCSEQGIAS